MNITDFNEQPLTFDFKDTEGFEYKSLEELHSNDGEEIVYTVKALYVNNNGKYGKQPLMVTDFAYVNLPSHLVPTVELITKDEKLVDDINNNKVGVQIYTYVQEKYDKKCWSIKWVDLSPELEPIDEQNIPF